MTSPSPHPSTRSPQTNKRTGWVNQGINQPESVMDHMGRCARSLPSQLLPRALELTPFLDARRMALMCLAFPETQTLDIGKCVLLSMVHDIAEADVGDITPEHASGVSKATKLALEEVRPALPLACRVLDRKGSRS